MSVRYFVKCGECDETFDLRFAPWCDHQPLHTKLCPNGHCICHLLPQADKWRVATELEQKYGFKTMLKEEFGGAKEQ
jgi:hypothetical protein